MAVGAPGVQDGDGMHRQMIPSCAGAIYSRMPPDAREGPRKDCAYTLDHDISRSFQHKTPP